MLLFFFYKKKNDQTNICCFLNLIFSLFPQPSRVPSAWSMDLRHHRGVSNTTMTVNGQPSATPWAIWEKQPWCVGNSATSPLAKRSVDRTSAQGRRTSQSTPLVVMVTRRRLKTAISCLALRAVNTMRMMQGLSAPTKVCFGVNNSC